MCVRMCVKLWRGKCRHWLCPLKHLWNVVLGCSHEVPFNLAFRNQIQDPDVHQRMCECEDWIGTHVMFVHARKTHTQTNEQRFKEGKTGRKKASKERGGQVGV